MGSLLLSLGLQDSLGGHAPGGWQWLAVVRVQQRAQLAAEVEAIFPVAENVESLEPVAENALGHRVVAAGFSAQEEFSQTEHAGTFPCMLGAVGSRLGGRFQRRCD